MKKYIAHLSVIVLVMLGSCTNDFEKINVNPVAPVDVQPELLLRKVLFDYADQMSYEGFVAGNLLGQLFTAIDFNLFDRHSLTEAQYGGNPWLFLYENLRDNEILLTKSRSNPAYAVYEGPALIYKAYLTGVLTDLYGDVPYSQSLKGKEGNVTPVYDAQRDIYLGKDGIIENLTKAVNVISAYKGAQALQGDIIFGGNLSAWRKLANSLKFKYLMRLSAQENVAAELAKIYAGGDYIKLPSENAAYQFTASQPNNFRMSTARVGDFNLFIMSETVEEILTKLNDPRRQIFFRPTANNANVYKGLLNGPDASKLSISVGNYSFAGRIFREEAGKLKANFLTSFEVNFLMAEAAEKGFIAADAKQLYETGVTQAFEYWGATLLDTYLKTAPAAYKQNGANPLEQIITQKWLANIINGYEGWIEYRRTGFPKLKTISASLNQNLIPVRLPYPTTEDALNNANFRTAASKTNNNSVNSPVWWDK
ncbi:SusD/RagB family nutrient-binding outer membrane lipoprotein [Runella salmonicolor]|uniref:SusD/RagB family nutrient-binding outer membrane lipoprotein n=1 Tax=Runella salmonicolor TaxID=2950278 RepID=A0ABT1FSB6_9BACT|nr:SusD/RagB family nutrient-binding outer membrane lipoprotein [Runella salmonicolor]MCP1383523.1 SusD/RagB family nutrient-binding outer membrane lipoprotein [Runella salmonicolor]